MSAGLVQTGGRESGEFLRSIFFGKGACLYNNDKDDLEEIDLETFSSLCFCHCFLLYQKNKALKRGGMGIVWTSIFVSFVAMTKDISIEK